QIKIAGRVVNDVHPKDRDIAMVFQNYALYPHMTVRANMAFALKLRKVPKAEIQRRVSEAARILDLEPYLDRKPKALSGGQRQRVAVGRAIVREPKAFIFDEPLSNLDAKLRVTTRAELKQLHQRLKTTTIYVTHDQEEAMTLGDRVVVMSEGLIQQADSPFDVYQRPVNRFVASFIGMPPMNFMEGRLEADPAGGLWFIEGSPLPTNPEQIQRLRLCPAHEALLKDREGQPIVMGIRAQELNESAYGEALDAAVKDGSAFRILVNVVEPLGDVMDVSCSTAKNPLLRARFPAHKHLPVGEHTTVSLDMTAAHFFEPGEYGANLTLPAHAAELQPA
ncbi:MAG: ATP-binding cassette domain-containing protein, partial [Planctomycetota bacterium]